MSPAVGRETSKRLMPKQNPQRRRIRLAAEVDADIGVLCSILIAVKGRAPVFACLAVAAAVDVSGATPPRPACSSARGA